MLSRVGTSLLSVALATADVVTGCSEPRPAAEAAETAETTAKPEPSEPSAKSGAPGLGSQICTPGTTRECKTSWYDAEGLVRCVLESQACRADGYAWLACGDLDAGLAPESATDAAAEPDDAGSKPSGHLVEQTTRATPVFRE